MVSNLDNLAVKAHLLVRGHPFIYGENNIGEEEGVNLKIFISAISRQNPSSFCFQFRWSFNLGKFLKRKSFNTEVLHFRLEQKV